MSSTTGVHGLQSTNNTLVEDEYGEMEDQVEEQYIRHESVMRTKHTRGNGHHAITKRIMKGSSIQVGEVSTMCGPIHQSS